MSDAPWNRRPDRPRSTPIPDPDNPGRDLPPLTPAQFLGQASNLPWTPKPGVDVNAPFRTTSPPDLTATGSTSKVARSMVTVVLLLAIVAGLVAVLAQRKSVSSGSGQPAPAQAPVTSQMTKAIDSAPAPALTAESTLPTSQPVETTSSPPPTMLGAATNPPPPTPPTAFPGGADSLYGVGAVRSVTDQLDLAMPGDPTQFTQILVFPDYAVATAQDPGNPDALLGAYWRDGLIGNATVTSTGGSGTAGLIFSGGEVNWEAIADLVPQAASAVGVADAAVSYVVVQRSGFGSPAPIVIDVYVEGPSGSGYLEASASGQIIGTH